MNKVLTISNLTSDSSVVKKGSHILYMYNEIDKYIENAVQFIYEGLKQDTIILLIESVDILRRIKDQLIMKGMLDDDLIKVTFLITDEFYFNGQEFDVLKAGSKLNGLLQTYFDQGYAVRTWGKVPLPDQGSGLKQIITYECDCKDFVLNKNIISVCTYNDLTTPAYLQNELLKTHTHFMTDDMYSLSPFYNQKNHQALSDEKKEKLKRIERQNIELKQKNCNLAFENNLIRMKNEYIKQSESRVRKIINELPIPIIIRVDTNVVFANEFAQEQFMVEKETALQLFFEKFNQNIRDSFDNYKQEFHFDFHDKKKFYLVNSVEFSYEEEKAILHSFVDITQEKENELLIVRSEKMNIVGELAASVAHELRNPLTAIKGFFHMLKNSEDIGQELYYRVIEDELSRIEQISSELLTLAKPHSDNKKRHNIVVLIEEVKLLLTSQANMKSIEIMIQTSNTEMYINCEDTKIKQVFINLIKNAIDAMESNGEVRINIDKVNDHTQIQVIDQGAGIPKELLNKVGEPFYTTKEKGTGLGLMVCFQIIEKHEGTIHVDSRVGVGTTFTISLPIQKASLTV